ncbi:MAG: hypothetical protein R6W31_07015 [Bacteroidales bacterium]
MKRQSRIFVLSGLCIFFISSCCREGDSYFWFPKEAIQYYNENVAIKYYSPELQSEENYFVCRIDTGHSIFDYGDFCGRQDHYYPILYDVVLDSCENEKYFRITIAPDTIVKVIFEYGGNRHDYFKFNYTSEEKFQVEINGIKYNDVIIQNGTVNDSIEAFSFSLNYGILQYEFNEITFNLLPNE